MEKEEKISTVFAAKVTEYPQDTAITYQEQELDYGSLNAKANQLAHFLLSLSVAPNTPIAISMERSTEVLIAMLGVTKAHAAYVPLDISYPVKKCAYLWQSIPFLLTKRCWKEKFLEYKGQLIFMDDWAVIAEQSSENPTISDENLAYIIYTSGSTGTPKGVLVSQKAVLHYGEWFAKVAQCQRQDRIDFSSGYHFDMAVTNTIVALMQGLHIVISEEETKRDPRLYLAFLSQQKINIIKITPSYFRVLLYEIQNHWVALPHLKTIFLGGEPLFTTDCKAWLRLFPHHRLINEYGPTETTVAVSAFEVKNVQALSKQVPIGCPNPGTAFYLVDEAGREVQEGEVGELYIGGVQVALGYRDNPVLTKDKFLFKEKEGLLYKTGDRVKKRQDGNYEYLGRADSLVKIRGYRVELGEIESALEEYPGIEKAIVIAREMHLQEKQLIAYYTWQKAISPPTRDALRSFLQLYLLEYMIPVAFLPVKEFTLSSTGKLNKDLLPLPELQRTKVYQAPVTPLEEELCLIWSQELEVKNISMQDSFLELGGHSLAAARIISKINQVWEVTLAVKDLYQAATLAKLAEKLAKTQKKEEGLVNTVPQRNALPLADFQFALWISTLFEPSIKKLNLIGRKRIVGIIDTQRLQQAFLKVLQKHELLTCSLGKYTPAFIKKKRISFRIEEKDISTWSYELAEKELQSSLQELLQIFPWPKYAPLLAARVWILPQGYTELQISVPHYIADGFSMDILFSDLTSAYLHPCTPFSTKVKVFTDYVREEQKTFHSYKERDMLFWQEYLQDAGFFCFDENLVTTIAACSFKGYATFLPVPEPLIEDIQDFACLYQLSVVDILCAALGKALIACNRREQTRPVIINIVKSTREDRAYDATLGCFLRIDPIKLSLHRKSSFLRLAKEVHQAIARTAPYQKSLGFLKMAFFHKDKERKMLKVLLAFFSACYASIFSHLGISAVQMRLYARLAQFKKRQDFVLTLNVGHTFFNRKKGSSSRFLGYKIASMQSIHFDPVQVEKLLEAGFFRDEQGHPFLVLSSNLQPAFREYLGRTLLHMLQEEVQVKATSFAAY